MGSIDALDRIDYKRVDPKGMIKHIESEPQLYKDAFEQAKKHTLPSFYLKAKKIVLVGMGGSGAANDVLKGLLTESTNLVIESVHNYSLPGFVDSDTLVIASSYSGNTEETLTAFIAAHEKGAKLVAITTGGKLAILATKFDAPLFTFDYDCPPRASFPFLFTFTAQVFAKLGHIKMDEEEMEKVIIVLSELTEKYHTTNSLFSNPAKILAQKIHGKIPVIYASEKLAGAAARMKAQINENSKNFAFFAEFPELNHNDLEGIIYPKDNCYIVMLESAFENERIVIRENVTAELLKKNRVTVERIKFAHSQNRLIEILSIIMFGDFVSYYLAILNKANPGINDFVDLLKKRLS